VTIFHSKTKGIPSQKLIDEVSVRNADAAGLSCTETDWYYSQDLVF